MTAPPRRAPPPPRDRDRVILLAAALGLLGVGLSVRTLVSFRSPSAMHPPLRGLDPNTASWSDLALLPEIGEQTAHAIVAYRDAQGDQSVCVFRRAEDLLPVKGIGPKTLDSIALHLRFDSCP